MATETEHRHTTTGLSPFVCACFTLNYLIGTGFLTLPWAFNEAGILLSIATMVFVCVVANVASDYILTAMARADALVVLRKTTEGDTEALLDNEKATYESIETEKISEPDASALKVQFDAHGYVGSINETDGEEYYNNVKKHGKLLVGERKFELTELCQIFLGDAGLLAYGISGSLDIYGFLWAYASVFGSAMSHLIPLGFEDDYPVWLGIFFLIVFPLSMMHLSEQAMVQVFLSACRIAMVVLMVFTPLAAVLFGSDGDPKHHEGPVPHFGEQTEPLGSVWVDFQNIQKMFPAIVFCVLFHQAVPGLADEMTDKPKVGVIFGYTFALCGIAYSLLGIAGAWYFGDDVYQSANINWGNYHGGTGRLVEDDHGKTTWTDVALWAHVIRIFVVSFPAIDVISAFPIYAYVLGNTLMGIFHAKNIVEVQHNRKVLTFYRTIAATPPIVAAYFLRELGTITDYSGLVGLAIAFCFPPLLLIASEKRLKGIDAPFHTMYERLGTSKYAAIAMFCFGVVSIIYCFILLTF